MLYFCHNLTYHDCKMTFDLPQKAQGFFYLMWYNKLNMGLVHAALGEMPNCWTMISDLHRTIGLLRQCCTCIITTRDHSALNCFQQCMFDPFWPYKLDLHQQLRLHHVFLTQCNYTHLCFSPWEWFFTCHKTHVETKWPLTTTKVIPLQENTKFLWKYKVFMTSTQQSLIIVQYHIASSIVK